MKRWILWGQTLWACALILWGIQAHGQSLTSAEYFFDDDPGIGNGVAIVWDGESSEAALTLEAPLTGLSPGLHRMSVRFQQNDGTYSVATSQLFAVNAPPDVESADLNLPIAKAEYFWDEDPGPGQGIPMDFPAAGEVTSVSLPLPVTSGTVRLGVRTADLSGAWGVTSWKMVEATGIPGLTLSLQAQPGHPSTQQAFELEALGADPAGFTWWTDAMGEIVHEGNPWSVVAGLPTGQHNYVAHHLAPLNDWDAAAVVRFDFNAGSPADDAGSFADLSPIDPAPERGVFQDDLGAWTLESAAEGPGTSLTDGFTISYWLKLPAETVNRQIQLVSAADSLIGYHGLQTANYTAQHVFNGVAFNAGPSSHYADGEWHHIALTADGSGAVMAWLDGELKGSGNGVSGLDLGQIHIHPTHALDQFRVHPFPLDSEGLSDLMALENHYVSSATTLAIGEWSTAVSPAGPLEFCAGENVTLAASAGDAYLWPDGSTGATFEPTESGTYAALVTLGEFQYVTEPVEVIVHPLPLAPEVLTHPALADGSQLGSAHLAPHPSYPAMSYLWSSGAALASAVDLPAGEHTLTLTQGICETTVDFTIEALEGPASSEDIVGYEWYFDNAVPPIGSGNFVAMTPSSEATSAFLIDTEGLSAGQHLLNVRPIRADGTAGFTRYHMFGVSDYDPDAPLDTVPEPFVNAEYFFDEDPGLGQGLPLPMASAWNGQASFADDMPFPVEGLLPGPHILNVRFQSASGDWGVAKALSFLVEFPFPPNFPENPVPTIAAEYFFDGADPGVGAAEPLPMSPFALESSWPAVFDVSELAAGEHILNVRTKDVAGDWSVTRSSTFLIEDIADCTPPQVEAQVTAVNGWTATLAAAIADASPDAVLSWDFDGDGVVDATGSTATHTFPQAGSYAVLLTLAQGLEGECTAADIVDVQLGESLSTEVVADGPLAFCEGESVTLIAPEGSNHLWSNWAESGSIQVDVSGTYTCFYTDLNGLPAVSESVTVEVWPVADVATTVYGANPGALNGSAFVEVTGGSSLVYDYQWSQGSQTHAATGLAAGPVSLTVDDGQCPVTLEIVVPEVSLPDLVMGEYFWDGPDPGVGQATPLAGSGSGPIWGAISDLSTDGLSPGGHTLHVRFLAADGNWGHTSRLQVSLFDPNPQVAPSEPDALAQAEYFFDGNDPGPGLATAINATLGSAFEDFSFTPDVSTLSAGMHTLHVRLKDASGFWNPSIRHSFQLIAPQTDGLPTPVLAAAEYFITPADLDIPGPGDGTAVNWTAFEPMADHASVVPVAGLPTGAYRLQVRTRDLSGAWSITQSHGFEVTTVECVVPQPAFVWEAGDDALTATFTSTSGSVLADAAYSWDFNADGNVDATGTEVTHTFPHAGPHAVILRVIQAETCENAVDALVMLEGGEEELLIWAENSTICSDQTATLSAPEGATSVVWNTLDAGPELHTSESGVYTCSFTDAAGFARISVPFELTVHPAVGLTTDVFHPTGGLPNGSAQVTFTGGTSQPMPISWSTGAQTPYADGLTAGSYTVSAEDAHCPAEAEVTLIDGNSNTGIVQAMYRWDGMPDVSDFTSFLLPVGETSGAFVGIPTTGLAPGIHQLTVRVMDDEGTVSFEAQSPVHISEPFDPDTSGPAELTDVEFFFDAADPGPGAGLPGVIGTNDLSVAGLSPGVHKLSARVKNADGHWSTTQVGEFSQCSPPAAPEVVSATLTACAGEDLMLATTGSVGTVVWTAPDGATTEGPSLDLNALESEDAGTYLASQFVEVGCYSASTPVVVSVPNPPVLTALIDGPESVCPEGEAGVFYMTPVAEAVFYDWSFPEGAVAESGNNTNNISVDFSGISGDAFNVGLTVSNSCGSATASPFYVPVNCGGPQVNDCPEDVDNDGQVTVSDLLLVLGSFGCMESCGAPDISGDGLVSVADLLLLLSSFGDPCD